MARPKSIILTPSERKEKIAVAKANCRDAEGVVGKLVISRSQAEKANTAEIEKVRRDTDKMNAALRKQIEANTKAAEKAITKLIKGHEIFLKGNARASAAAVTKRKAAVDALAAIEASPVDGATTKIMRAKVKPNEPAPVPTSTSADE